MAKFIKVWFDNDAVMELVDIAGNAIGFSILNVSSLSTGKPLLTQLIST